jgi:hypothetical protein
MKTALTLLALLGLLAAAPTSPVAAVGASLVADAPTAAAAVPAAPEAGSAAPRRTGVLETSLVVPRGESAPDSLAVRFESTPAADGRKRDLIPRSTAACRRQDAAWRCVLPAGRLDLRLEAAGFIPQYRWGVAIAPGAVVKLGAIELQRGSSVSGRVETSTGAPITATCTVELLPAAVASQPSYLRRAGEPGLRARPGDRGFFRFAGVAPGSYALSAVQPGFEKTTVAPVIVERDRETAVEKALVLTPPLRLELALDPAADPWGKPWRVMLQRKEPGFPQLRAVASGPAPDGRFSRPGLAAGRYLLHVLDSEGAGFLSEEIDLDADRTLERTIDLVWVEGRVTKGDQPFATRLRFFGPVARSTGIRMASDARGAFSGVLPREGRWRVELSDLRRTLGVTVRRAKGARSAKVEIAIPDVRLSGDVVDESSEPIAGAQVVASDLGSGEQQTAVTDDRGAFELDGLPASPQLVSAEADLGDRHLSSDPVTVSLGKDHRRDAVRLTLHDQAPIDGVVTSPAGPVAGARLIAVPKGPLGIHTAEASTDAAGHFHLDVPAAARELQLLIAPPGFSFRSLALSAPFPKPLSIPVDDRGGSLVLRLPALDLADPAAAKPLIVEDGQPVLFSFLLSWAQTAGQGGQEPSRYVIPRMAEGDYAACLLDQEEQIQVLLGLAALTGKSCRHGTLAPRGELELDLTAGAR